MPCAGRYACSHCCDVPPGQSCGFLLHIWAYMYLLVQLPVSGGLTIHALRWTHGPVQACGGAGACPTAAESPGMPHPLQLGS
jgi:hypothetical protein